MKDAPMIPVHVRRFAVLSLALAAVPLLGTAPVTSVPVRPVAATKSTATVRILNIGDSISAAGKWQIELCRLMAANGVTCDIHNAAVAGTHCTYWPDKITALLAAEQPDVVTFFCGTNDDASTKASRDQVGWAWRYTVEAIHTYRPADPIKIVPGFIQYSDPMIAPQWLQDFEPQINDIIYSNWTLYQPSGWFVGTPDFQKIPATADYLDDGGVHPNLQGAGATPFDAVTADKGYRAMGRIVYDSIAPGMGWPATTEPALCGMYGHRRGLPRPAGYVLCP